MDYYLEIVLAVFFGFVIRIIYEKIFYGSGSIELIPQKVKTPEDYPYILKFNTDFKELEKRKHFLFKIKH